MFRGLLLYVDSDKLFRHFPLAIHFILKDFEKKFITRSKQNLFEHD